MKSFTRFLIIMLCVGAVAACDIIKFESKKDKKTTEEVIAPAAIDNSSQTKIITNNAEVAELLLKIETLNSDVESLTSIIASKDTDIQNLSENNGLLKTTNATIQTEIDQLKRLQMILLIVAAASILLNIILVIAIIKSAKKRKAARNSIFGDEYASKKMSTYTASSVKDDNDGDTADEKKSEPKTSAKSATKPATKKTPAKPAVKKPATKQANIKPKK